MPSDRSPPRSAAGPASSPLHRRGLRHLSPAAALSQPERGRAACSARNRPRSPPASLAELLSGLDDHDDDLDDSESVECVNESERSSSRDSTATLLSGSSELSSIPSSIQDSPDSDADGAVWCPFCDSRMAAEVAAFLAPRIDAARRKIRGRAGAARCPQLLQFDQVCALHRRAQASIDWTQACKREKRFLPPPARQLAAKLPQRLAAGGYAQYAHDIATMRVWAPLQKLVLDHLAAAGHRRGRDPQSVFGALPDIRACGYYGRVGHRAVAAFLEPHCAALARLYNATGARLEAHELCELVLVPEILVRLVAEDHGWYPGEPRWHERARAVLRDSEVRVDLGRLDEFFSDG